jgi:hypothetical protein
MNPQPQLEAALMELFKDPQLVELEMSKTLAWQLCSVIQLACRHPHFTGTTRWATQQFAREVLAALCANNNDLRQLAEMGWHKQFDDVMAQPPQANFTQEELNFLLWCIGFAEGRARETKHAAAGFIRSNCDATRVKLMSLSAAFA